LSFENFDHFLFNASCLFALSTWLSVLQTKNNTHFVVLPISNVAVSVMADSRRAHGSQQEKKSMKIFVQQIIFKKTGFGV